MPASCMVQGILVICCLTGVMGIDPASACIPRGHHIHDIVGVDIMYLYEYMHAS